MLKKVKQSVLFLLPMTFLVSCRLPNAEDYSRELLQYLSSGMTESHINEIIHNGGYLFQIAALAGILLFLYGMIQYLFYPGNKSPLYLALASLTAGLVYLTPYLNLIGTLPEKTLLIAQIRTILLLSYYVLLRNWSIKTFHHRKKPWITYTRLSTFGLIYILVGLAWLKPSLLSYPWPIATLGVFTFADTTMCSILSLKRRNDRSGIGGTLFSVVFAASAAILIIISDRSFSFFRSLDEAFFILPSGMLVFTTLMTAVLMQSELKKQSLYLREYRKQTEDQQENLEKEIKRHERLEKEMEQILHIPFFNIKSARKALSIDPTPPLNMPEGWEGAHFMGKSESELPVMAAWPFSAAGSSVTDVLLMSEAAPEDRYAYPVLQYIRKSAAGKIGESRAATSLFSSLNNELEKLGESPEHRISAVLLQFMDKNLLCATAGNTLVWYKKPGSPMIPLSSKEIPATFQQGLGYKPFSRETGRPFRLPVEKGDLIILTSRNLIMREQSLNGQIYGKESLIRVLENHESGSAESILSSLIKDFDDFDMGNTRDRQIYAGVFKKV